MLGAVVRQRRRHRRRVIAATLLVPLAVVTLTIAACGATLGAKGYHGPKSDHFDGERFLNMRDAPHAGPREMLRWRLNRDHGPWRAFENVPPGPKPETRVTGGRLRVTLVGHATTLLQMDGVNVLADPVWSDRCSPVSFAGPSRVRPPAIRFEDLPPIDAIVISHAHYDHLDVDTLKRLVAVHHPRIFVGLGISQFLAEQGIPGATDVDWWDSVTLAEGVTLTSVPAQHFSNRGLGDQDQTLWMGAVLSGPSGDAYFAGDTGAGPHFGLISQQFPHLRLAVLPLGAFRPEWFMERIHVSPEQSLEAHRQLGAATSVGMHFGTFDLGDDGQDEPADRLRAAVAASPEPKPDFRIIPFGEPFEVPPLAH